MICAIYPGAHDLYGVRERLSRYDMATIMQDPEFSIDEFPEERLAKAMDDIWKAGPEKLMFAIASQVIAAFRLDTSYFHFDTPEAGGDIVTPADVYTGKAGLVKPRSDSTRCSRNRRDRDTRKTGVHDSAGLGVKTQGSPKGAS